MKSCYFLLILAACTGAPQTTAAPSTSLPICPERERPETDSPTASPPVATSPGPPDWHCIELDRNDGDRHGMCWASSNVCEEKRRTVATKKLGTSSPCATQPIAYCVSITYPLTNSWQAYCARTPEGCQEFHSVILKNRPTKRHEIDTCRPKRNIDPLKAMDAEVSALDR